MNNNNLIKAYQLIADINWKLLREQKTDLYFSIISGMDHYPKQETLDGIMKLLEALQNFAVEVIGVPSSEVYDKAFQNENEYCGLYSETQNELNTKKALKEQLPEYNLQF